MESEPDHELLSAESKGHLLTAGSWARFIGIIGFVFTAFFGLLSIFMITGGSALMSMMSSVNPDVAAAGLMKGSGMMIGILYLIITAIYFVISWWTFKFGSEIKQGFNQNSPDLITSSFMNLKNYFQAYGVLMLIVVGMMVFSMITVMMVGFFN